MAETEQTGTTETQSATDGANGGSSDSTNGGGNREGSSAGGAGGTNSTGSTNGAQNGSDSRSGGGGGSNDSADLIRDLRKESTDRRHENTRLTSSLTAASRDLNEAREKLTALEARVREYQVSDALGAALSALQTPHGKTIERLVDLASIKIGAEGKADEESVKAAINKVKADHPKLFGVSRSLSKDAGATNNGDANTAEAVNSMIRKAAGR